jgi:ribose transport system substrate-binding protein
MEGASSMNRDPHRIQVVVRACEVLKAFQHDGEALVLSDVVTRTGISKTTVFRLLQSLVAGGLVQRVGARAYRCQVRPLLSRPFRLGFAAQQDSEFSSEVTRSLQHAAARERVEMIIVNNRYSAREAFRNADLLIRERVDLVLEFQIYERMGPVIASKFLEAGIPVIAIEIPQPGATYFGANNYRAGLIGGKALGLWAKENWDEKVEQVLLLELPIAGPIPQLRITGMLDGLQAELPSISSSPVAHLDGKGRFEQVLDKVRRYLRRTQLKRTLVGAVNDTSALAAVRGFEEAGAAHLCAVMGQNATADARNELRRSGTRLIGSVAYFPERYGDELIPLALGILEKKPAPPAVFVKHQLITPKNVDLVYPLDPCPRGSIP